MLRAILLAVMAAPLCAQTYDLVIANGRVLDPASKLDAVRHIGIRAGKIAAISDDGARRARHHRRHGTGGRPGIHRSAFARADAGELPLQGARRRHHGARNGGGRQPGRARGTRSAKAAR